MSLINEALKRAEAEKAGLTPAGVPEMILPEPSPSPAGQDGPTHDGALPAVAPTPPARPSRMPILITVCICSLAAIGLMMAWSVARQFSQTPGQASAADRQVAQAPTATQTTPAAQRDPTAEATDNTANLPQPPVVELPVVEVPNVEPPAVEVVSPTVAPPTSSEVQVRGRSFSLSGIMKGANGDVAIVNGRFVGVGETVDGARVRAIRRHSVELEYNGQTIVVQM